MSDWAKHNNGLSGRARSGDKKKFDELPQEQKDAITKKESEDKEAKRKKAVAITNAAKIMLKAKEISNIPSTSSVVMEM